MTVDSTKWIVIELMLHDFITFGRYHVVKFERPKVNEEQIRQKLRVEFIEKYDNWFFDEDVKIEYENKVANIVRARHEKILKLPKPVIFTWEIIETKKIKWNNDYEMMLMKFQINDETVSYFLEWYTEIKELKVWLDFFPTFLNSDDVFKTVSDMKNVFLWSVEHSIAIESCFTKEAVYNMEEKR